ncbi:hypothetical protein ACWEV4_04395 [Streptomyces sp. NPDC003860]
MRLLDDPRWAGLFDGIDLAMEYPPCRLAPCDLGGSTWNTSEYGRDANFELRNLTAKGVHPNKVVMGLPTHAWGWQGIRSPVGLPVPGPVTRRGAC